MKPPLPPPSGDPRPAPPALYRALQTVEAPLAGLAGLTCREFARLTVARLDRPLTAGEAVRHSLHGTMCRLCNRFAHQFTAINDLARELEAESSPPPATIPDPAAARIATAVRAAAQE